MKIGYASNCEGFEVFPLILQILELKKCDCEKIYVQKDFIDDSITDEGLETLGIERRDSKDIQMTSRDVLLYVPNVKACPPSYIKEMLGDVKVLLKEGESQ